MTDLLTEAFEEASHLSTEEQDRLAKWILAELRDEAKWEKSFASSQDALARLAKQALAEHESGETEPFPEAEAR